MQKLFSNSGKVFLVLMALAFLMRIFSFFRSVLDHDESTYIIIADALRHGQVYLRDVVDTKPIGIFLLFGLFQFLFGKSILMIRIIAAIWVAVTGWMIYLVHRQLLVPASASSSFNPAPVASGMIYVFIISIYSAYGLSPNTELFFNLFTITALYCTLTKKSIVFFLLSGFLLGLGFIIKYVVLFDAIAIGIFYLWIQVYEKNKLKDGLVRCVLMGIGFLIPFLVDWMYYRHLGLGETFTYFTFKLSGMYMMKPGWTADLKFVFTFYWNFFPVIIWFFYCIWDWRTVGSRILVLGTIWSILVTAIILIPGRLYPHYFVQFMLPLSLLSGSFFDPLRPVVRGLAWIRKPAIGYSLLFLTLLINTLVQKAKFYDRPDYPREVAAYLTSRLEPGDVLYTGDYNHIIYQLTGTSSPTPYIHSSLIWMPVNAYALKINQKEEFEKILNQKPRFILIRYPLHEDNPIHEILQNSYRVVKLFSTEVMVYERN
ncbi:MAG: glycosyltransferase family 39 protein [Saprospiraceae bacterium]